MYGNLQKRRERLKGVYISEQYIKVNEQFRKKLNEDVNRNRKLF